jgi:LCP family protein required for cell wall assembly
MMVHIAADRRHVYLVSIPRDTYTVIHDNTGSPQQRSKINDAFAEYGPNGTIATVEQLTDVRMKHLALINFNGFKDITRAVGGVEVYIPRAFYDPSQKVYWKAGKQNLEGDLALKYVRTRYGLARSDFDRIARQQNFMRALMKKLLDKGTTRNPVRLTRTLGALTENIVVEVKAQAAIGCADEAQLLNYLKASGMRRGLILNFGATSLQHKRMVLG